MMKIKVKDSGWVNYHRLNKDEIYDVKSVIPFDNGDYSSYQVIFAHPDHIGRIFESILWDDSVEIVGGCIDEYK